jgi:hypothetical protein
MKNLLLFAIIFMLAGCADEMINENFDDNLLKSGKMIEKDFEMLNLNCYFIYEPIPDACSPSGMQGIITGEATASHLGLCRVIERYCVDENGFPVSYIEGYFTAANGDKVFYLEPYDVWEENGVSCAAIKISGGTGRFENAEGEFVNRYIVDWVNQTIASDIKGTIIY